MLSAFSDIANRSPPHSRAAITASREEPFAGAVFEDKQPEGVIPFVD